MPHRWLLIADPPHGDVNAVEVAKRLELLPLEVRGRIGYPIPDPWRVFENEVPARELERALRAGGIRCAAVQAGELARVPAAVEAEEIELPAEGLAWTRRGGVRGGLDWAQVRSVILYRRVIEDKTGPSDAEKRIAGTLNRASSAARAVQRMVPGGRFLANQLSGAAREIEATTGSRINARFDEVLEVAGVGGAGPQRGRFVKSEMGFTGLGPLLQPVAHANWLTFVKLVGERATAAVFDRRGDKVQARPLTTLEKVGLPKIFAGSTPRLEEIADDPLEHFGTFVAWRHEVLQPV